MLQRAVKKGIAEKFQDRESSENGRTSTNFEFFKKYKTSIIVIGIVVFIIIIVSVSQKLSNNNSSNNNSLNDYGKDEKICKGSDGRYYDKPVNSYCDGSKTSQGWTCNNLYTAKSEGDRKQDHSSRYCECRSSHVKCSSFNDSQVDLMQIKVDQQQGYLNNMYLNKYNQASVNQYNGQVQYVNDLIGKRNRYMSENCTCS